MIRIGLTYDLRDQYLAEGYGEEETAEFDAAETIDALEGALRRLGYRTERIGHVRDLAARLVGGARWDLVFNIAEGLDGIGREAQVPALLDAYGIPYTFSDPLTMALTLDKAMAKRIVRDHGIATAPFAVVETAAEAARLDLPPPFFAKPLAEGTGKGIDGRSRVTTRRALAETCRCLLRRYRQPVLVESYLPGREFTVGIVGSGAKARVVGVLEIELLGRAEPMAYSYVNKEECATRVRYSLADDAEAGLAGTAALAAWRALRCRDGGRVDLRSDRFGLPNFLEVNPLAGLRPGHSDLPILAALAGWSYDRLIGAIVQSSLERIVRRTIEPTARLAAAAE